MGAWPQNPWPRRRWCSCAPPPPPNKATMGLGRGARWHAQVNLLWGGGVAPNRREAWHKGEGISGRICSSPRGAHNRGFWGAHNSI